MLSSEETHHALRVLRLRAGDPLTVTDGRGRVARCSLVETRGARATARIVQESRRARPGPELALYQAAPKGTKMDEVVEHCTGLGVAEVCVFESGRTVVRWDGTKRQRLVSRWQGIAFASAKQSRNPYLTVIEPIVSWELLLEGLRHERFAVALWEEATLPLRRVLPAKPSRAALVVGPEGGFSRQEAASLQDAGATPVALGPRILRTELAPVVAASALLWHYGVIG